MIKNAYNQLDREAEKENLLKKLLDYPENIPLFFREELNQLVRQEHNLAEPSKIFRLSQLKRKDLNALIVLLDGASLTDNQASILTVLPKMKAHVEVPSQDNYLSEAEIKSIRFYINALNEEAQPELQRLKKLSSQLVCEKTALPLELCRPIYEKALKLLCNALSYNSLDEGWNTLILLALQYSNEKMARLLFSFPDKSICGKENQGGISAFHYDRENRIPEKYRIREEQTQKVRETEKALRQYLEEWDNQASKIANRVASANNRKSLLDGFIENACKIVDAFFKTRHSFLERDEQVRSLLDIIEEGRYKGWTGAEYAELFNEISSQIPQGLLGEFGYKYFNVGSRVAHTANELTTQIGQSSNMIGFLLRENDDLLTQVSEMNTRVSSLQEEQKNNAQKTMELENALEEGKKETTALKIALEEGQKETTALKIALEEGQKETTALKIALEEGQKETTALKTALDAEREAREEMEKKQKRQKEKQRKKDQLLQKLLKERLGVDLAGLEDSDDSDNEEETAEEEVPHVGKASTGKNRHSFYSHPKSSERSPSPSTRSREKQEDNQPTDPQTETTQKISGQNR